jgi:phosphoserine phosphatase RsbU/P
MAEKILIAQQGRERRRRLHDLLRTRGFFVQESATFEQTLAMLEEFPALLIFDADLAEGESAEMWETLRSACERWSTSCLCFFPSRDPQADLAGRYPWLAGTLRRLEDSQIVLDKITGILTIRRLRHELNLAHGMLSRKQQEFQESMRAAAAIQRNLLPRHLPKVDTLQFAYRFLPCEEIGGDLFNILRLDENTLMVYLFDVSGHGVSSALVSVSVHQSLSPSSGRIIKQRLDSPPYYCIPPPSQVVEALAAEFPFERFEKFFTIAYLLIDIDSGRVRYCNAGHPPPLLLRKEGGSEILSTGGGLVGLSEVGPFGEGEARLYPGDRLFIYSDGIIEYGNGRDELFGEERLLRRLSDFRRHDLGAICGKVIEALISFGRAAPLRDDVTLLGIEYRGR